MEFSIPAATRVDVKSIRELASFHHACKFITWYDRGFRENPWFAPAIEYKIHLWKLVCRNTCLRIIASTPNQDLEAWGLRFPASEVVASGGEEAILIVGFPALVEIKSSMWGS
jgi:hypothetical protein